MKTFQEFLEQAGSPSMSAHQQMYKDLALSRAKERIRFSSWSRRQSIRNKDAQNREMHADLERRHALP